MNSQKQRKFFSASAPLLAGCGTSSLPETTALAGKNFQAFYTKSTGTGTYRQWRGTHYFGNAGSGEVLRPVATANGLLTADIHAIHASLAYATGATQSTDNYQAAVRGTVQVPNNATAMNAAVAFFAEFYTDGASSALKHSGLSAYMRCLQSGDGKANLDSQLALFSIEGTTIGTYAAPTLVCTVEHDEAPTHLVKIRVNGADYFLLAKNAAT